MPPDITHPMLGNLTWNNELNTWESMIELRPDHPIDVSLSVRMDTEPMSNIKSLLASGLAMVEWARQFEPKCRQRVADELLELYNATWAPAHSAAPMTREEFIQRITPSSLCLDIDGSGYFYWEDDDMFAGHLIEVRFDQDHTVSEVGLAG